MSSSLSSIVDNLSEIYEKKANYIKKEKKIMSEFRLIVLKNNALYYKCKECNDE